MLSPRYLQGLGDELADIYSQLETDILQDMARRIARLGRISDATKWQAEMLAEAGGLQGNIQKILKKYDAKIARQVEAVYREALEKNTAADNRIFKDATGRTVSDSNAQQMLATIQKAHSDLSRLTLTTAATSQELFVQQANRAFMDVQSGAFDYNTSMKHAADELSARGITTVQYENGKPVVRTIESAVRMNILTGINQTASTMTLNNCEELGCDLVETSAHIGARPSHEAWQGRIFSLSGTSDKYPSFDQCGYGTADGICGINCRHSFYPFFEGTDRHYTQDDLDELSKETVTYKDNQYTRYEGEQQLRKIERTIRQYKRRALTQEAAGVDNTAARIKIGEWQAAARDFTQQTGIQRDRAREYIGTKDGKQPRAVTATQTTSPKATGGSTGGILDKSETEKTRFAEEYYASIRNRKSKSDIQHIAKNTNFSESDISAVRKHLFETADHLRESGKREKFYPDAEIAQAWQRLEQGKQTELDIMLFNHEKEELTLMEKYGYSYDKAHLFADLKYPWEYKKGNAWSDDSLQENIKGRLNRLLRLHGSDD